MLGLEPKTVRLYAHDSDWVPLYEDEERRIRAALGDLALDIQHYGSTSVPGIQAKPILDILVGIEKVEDGPLCIPLLEAIGYEYAPQAGIPGDYTFGRGECRTHLVHVVQYGGHNWTNGLHFRDALRRNSALAREYEALKIGLALRYPDNRADYTEGKTAFVQNVLAAAEDGNEDK